MTVGTRSLETLSEYNSKRMLASSGIPVTSEQLVDTPDAAVEAARVLGIPVVPVVLKLCGPRIAHKTERDLVRLGLADDAAVRAAAEELLAAARPEDGEVALLVSQMVRGKRELIAGAAHDPTFGPCIMLGIGGIFAEVVADVAFRLVPLRPSDVEDMIDSLQNAAWLDAFRGEPPVDRERLGEVLIGLSRLMEADQSIQSIDVNPLIIAEDGVPIAVDALVERTCS